jgi:hypothetical protein
VEGGEPVSKRPKLISTGYDIAKHPDAETVSAIDWFELTGEDIGLPAGYRERYEKAAAAEAARRKAREKPGKP